MSLGEEQGKGSSERELGVGDNWAGDNPFLAAARGKHPQIWDIDLQMWIEWSISAGNTELFVFALALGF